MAGFARGMRILAKPKITSPAYAIASTYGAIVGANLGLARDL
jgi:hypothetical protein